MDILDYLPQKIKTEATLYEAGTRGDKGQSRTADTIYNEGWI